MIGDPDLKSEAARIRDRAQEVRKDLVRHSQEPNWDLVRMSISQPLVELRDRINQELQKRESRKALGTYRPRSGPRVLRRASPSLLRTLGERRMTLGSIILGARQWLVPAIALGLLASLAMLYSYWRTPAGQCTVAGQWLETAGHRCPHPVPRGALVQRQAPASRCQPVCSAGRQQPEHERQDRRGAANRGDQVKAMLSPGTDWQTQLSQDFDVRWYGFDTRVEFDRRCHRVDL